MHELNARPKETNNNGKTKYPTGYTGNEESRKGGRGGEREGQVKRP